MFAKKKKKGFTLSPFEKGDGFTLIELLVVIAIIGILAGIVLVSLSGARNRAKDSRIITDMGQLRTTAETYYGNKNTYGGLDSDPDVTKLKSDIESQGGAGAFQLWINNDGTAYCATAKLNSGEYWCVDSTLKSEQDADRTLTNCVSGCVGENSCKCD